MGIKPGLESIRELLSQLEHPESGLRFVHVAGTNGKGSVCALIESVLRTAGVRTGLFTSPHLVSMRERIRLAGELIGRQQVLAGLDRVKLAAERMARERGLSASFFEVTTALAALAFREAGVDVVVWETGMGGRLDATNAVVPLVSVITTIASDHTAYLGRRLVDIAREKAGIIKPGVPVVSGVGEPAAREVIEAAARSAGAPWVQARHRYAIRCLEQDWTGQRLAVANSRWGRLAVRLPLLGAHQRCNLAVALAALEILADRGLPIERDSLVHGLETVSWPGRLQVVSYRPRLVVDGAHNATGMRCLRDALRDLGTAQELGAVFGVLRDKPAHRMMRTLLPLAARLDLVPVNSERSESPARLADLAAQFGFGGEVHVHLTVADGLAAAARWQAAAPAEQRMLLVAGSLYLVGEALAVRGWGEADDLP